jgi:hypothetical protein
MDLVEEYRRETKTATEPFRCRSCGALYEMTSSKVRGVDEGRAYCAACGDQMKSWSGHHIFAFRLLRSPDVIDKVKQ